MNRVILNSGAECMLEAELLEVNIGDNTVDLGKGITLLCPEGFKFSN